MMMGGSIIVIVGVAVYQYNVMSSQRQKKRNAQFKRRRYDQKETNKTRQESTKKTTEQEEPDQLEEPVSGA